MGRAAPIRRPFILNTDFQGSLHEKKQTVPTNKGARQSLGIRNQKSSTKARQLEPHFPTFLTHKENVTRSESIRPQVCLGTAVHTM